VTVDFWGTLLFDGPSSDNRYKRVRLDEFERILAAAGVRVARAALDRGYEESARWLAGVWRAHRDVPVHEHVRAILEVVDRGLPDRLGATTMAGLVEAYARPALVVPPTVDGGARAALAALRERGYTLAVVSNTMRTPGVTLRRLLAHYGLLEFFAHTAFSDEVGVRKPDAAIFFHALRAVGGEAGTAVHVGDDGVLDVQGARSAGMRVVQVGRGDRRSSPGGAPDAVIPGLAALPAALSDLEAR
jgi:HAD superfamily hydrolase (TIGR01509 family)